MPEAVSADARRCEAGSGRRGRGAARILAAAVLLGGLAPVAGHADVVEYTGGLLWPNPNDGTIICVVDCVNGGANSSNPVFVNEATGVLIGGVNNVVFGQIINSGAIEATSSLFNGGEIVNFGAIRALGMTLNQGELGLKVARIVNLGGAIQSYGLFRNESTGLLENTSGTISIEGGSLVNAGRLINADFLFNRGMLENFGTLLNSGSLLNAGKVLNIDAVTNLGTFRSLVGDVDNFGDFTNVGTVTNDAASTFTNIGTLDNVVLFENARGGKLLNPAGTVRNIGRLSNDLISTVESLGSVENLGEIENSGEFRIRAGTMTNAAGGSLANDGLFENFGTFENEAGGSLINEGGVLKNASQLKNSGEIENIGGELTNLAFMTNEAEGAISISSLGGEDPVEGTFTNRGSFTNKGMFSNDAGTVTNIGPIFDNVGDMRNGALGSFVNVSFMKNKDGGTFSNSGAMTNSGTLTNSATMTNAEDSTFDNSGMFENAAGGSFTSSGAVTNHVNGRFRNYGATVIEKQGTLQNDGVIDNRGLLVNNGAIAGDGAFFNGIGGRLQGAGEFIGDGFKDGGGVVAPGNSIGVMSFDGDFILNRGVLEIEIGELMGDIVLDRLEVAGDATLEGATVRFLFLDGFDPADALLAALSAPLEFLSAGRLLGALPTFDFTALGSLGFAFSAFSDGGGLVLQAQGDGGPGGVDVPEPASLPLLASALALMSAAARRRRVARSC